MDNGIVPKLNMADKKCSHGMEGHCFGENDRITELYLHLMKRVSGDDIFVFKAEVFWTSQYSGCF